MARTWPLLFFTFLSFLRKYLRTHKAIVTPKQQPDRHGITTQLQKAS
jgi:hypothetical protein